MKPAKIRLESRLQQKDQNMFFLLGFFYYAIKVELVELVEP
jgi:hypothetical protein